MSVSSANWFFPEIDSIPKLLYVILNAIIQPTKPTNQVRPAAAKFSGIAGQILKVQSSGES